MTMNQESLAELLVRKRWYNPFPKFKFTERPDAAAAQILEGDVVVLVDNSPAAIILPTTLFDVMEEANDYYFPPITGSVSYTHLDVYKRQVEDDVVHAVHVDDLSYKGVGHRIQAEG